jgi:molecular chaperone DnaK (HSP70)
MANHFGIDLGTSNCALAHAAEDGPPTTLPLTQVMGPTAIGEQTLLPSNVFLPAEGEFPAGVPSLPWQTKPRQWVLGALARERAPLQPDRVIASAKSWLCHPHADRRGPILPWESTTVSKKWSPLEVSAQLLAHIVKNLASLRPDTSPEAAHTVVTVPASFDEVARGLTREAAEQAGLAGVTLLEEPQAAFYAWIENQGAGWRSQVDAGDLLLVCDIGGGTADFSLIAVSGREGDLELERVAVGEHLLLGGDNMDLALAHDTAATLADVGTELDEWQFLALVHAARAAKESLLADASLKEVPVAIPSRGSRLVASTIATTITRAQVDAIVLDGFFPLVEPTDMPAMRRAGGLRESGLPYAADACLTKHLARFLTRAKQNISSSPHLVEAVGGAARTERSSLLIPDAVLFNGGAFNAAPLRQRILDQLAAWAGSPVVELEGARPDHAVALGAAAYARLRATGKGLRIKAGTARSYYIGMESSGMAVPGRKPKTKALCVAAQGMEEGSNTSIPDREFFLYTGETSEFRFFHSEIRAGDQPGELLPDADVLEETAKLEVEIPPPAGHTPGEEVPVRIEAGVSELGQLELHFVHPPTNERWKLEFNVRMQ